MTDSQWTKLILLSPIFGPVIVVGVAWFLILIGG